MYNTTNHKLAGRLLALIAAGISSISMWAQPAPMCDDCFGITGDCAIPAVSVNPDATAECPVLKIIFLLDESGSIAAAGAQEQVKEGVLAFLNGLNNTGAEVALVEFAHQAHLVSDYVEVDDAFINDIQGYFNGTALNGQIYNAGGSTNWHSALDTALSLDTANLVLFFTDGDPTSYMTNSGTVSVCISSGSTQIPEIVNPMKLANFFKDSLGTHMFMLGVGAVNLLTLTNLSGAVAWQQGVTEVMTSDYALESFATLSIGLADFAHDLCGTDIAFSMLAPASPVCVGETVSLTFKVVNTGAENAVVDLIVRDTFPAGVTNVTCLSNCADVCVGSGCVPALANNTLEWTVGNLPAGDSVEMTVQVTTVNPGQFSNYAWALANNVDTASQMAMIEALAKPVADAGSDVSICTGGSATLMATATSGLGPYSYAWNNGPMTPGNTVSPASTMMYIVTVTDANLCTSTAEVTVYVVGDPVVDVTSDDLVMCDGAATTISANVTGGAGTTFYQWQLYDNTNGWEDITGADGATYATPTLTPGMYSYRVMVAQASGCDAISDQVDLNVSSDANVSIAADNPEVCVGGTSRVTATVTGGTTNISFQWQSSVNGTTWNNVGINSDSYDAPTTTPGITLYRVIVTDNGNGCSDPVSDSISVTVVDDAIITLSADNAEVCVDGAVQLTAEIVGGSSALSLQWQSSPDGVLDWTNIGGAVDTFYNPVTSSAGVFYFRPVVTDGTPGCATPNPDVIDIRVNADPTAQVAIDNAEVCLDGVAELTASLFGGSPQVHYHWQSSPDGISGWADLGVSDTSYNPPSTVPGTFHYRVRLDDTIEGCTESESAPISFIVRDTAVATALASNTQPCENDPVILSVAITGGSSALSYIWQSSTDGLDPWTDVGVSNTDYSPPTNLTGTIHYRVRIDDDTEGCTEPNSNIVPVQVLSRPVASVSIDDPFCYLSNGHITVLFDDDPVRSDIEFSLNNQVSYEPALPDSLGSQTYTGIAPGTYAVWARWENDECPIFVDSVTLVNIPCGSICGTVHDDVGSPISNVMLWLYADTDGDGNADGSPLDSTYTDSDAGTYCFEDIPIGDYVIVEQQPLNYDDVSDYDHETDSLDTDGIDTLLIIGLDTTVQLADNDIPVTLYADEYDDGNDFIEDPYTGDITGYVIDDRDDALDGLTVYLHEDLNQDGIPDVAIAGSAVTNLTGYYQFTGIEPGFYVLVSEQLPQYNNISDVDTSIVPGVDEDGDDAIDGPDNNIPVVLLPGEIDADNLFVDGRPGTICGHVLDDTELPIEGVTIELYFDLDSDGNKDSTVQATAQTTALGRYCFTDVEPRDYVLYQIHPANYDDVSDYDRSINALDADGVDTAGVGPDNDIPVILQPGELDDDNDFIEDPHPGNISGAVWDDIVTMMSGVTIELYADVNADGLKDSLVATQNTVGGQFLFAGYEPGTYILEQIQPFLYTSIADIDTSTSILDPDGNDAIDGPDNNIPVVLAPGETDAGNSFAEGRPGNICGSVYDDVLNPISNVVIYLYIDSTGNGEPDGQPIDSTLTDGDSGNYCFSDLLAGNYVVQEVQPLNYDDISDFDMSIDALDPDGYDGAIPDNDIPVTVSWGEEDSNNDFVEDPHPGNIMGYVLDEIGAPITGVQIKLYADDDGDGNANGPQLDSTVSNLVGYFVFTGIEPDAYVIEETQPFNYSSISDFDQTPDPDGNDNAEGADDDIPVIVSPGEDDEDNIFVNGNPGTICGNVRDDRGGPIGDVVLTLYGDADGDGNADGPILAVTMSDSLSGNYCFNTLEPSKDYVIVETQPAFYNDVFDYDLTTGAFDPDGNDSLQTPDNDIPVTLEPGESDSGNDFIEDPFPGTISGSVTNDIGEAMVGITIYLYPDVDHNGVADSVSALAAQSTNGSGVYAFNNIEPDWYVLVEAHPFPYSSISDTDTSPDPDGDDSFEAPDNNIPVVLLPGESDTDNNFVNGRPGDICGTVEDDLGSPISLVLVRLYNDPDGDGSPDGAAIDSVLSDSDSGGYCFSDLEPKFYVVEEQQPLTYGELEDYDRLTDSVDTDGDDRIEGTDNNVPVYLAPGESDDGNDFIDIACPDAPVIAGDTVYNICDGQQVVFIAQSQGLGTEAYSWNFGDGATPATATGEGPHGVTYDWTANNESIGADVTLEIAKDGCGTQQAQVSTVFVHQYPDATISGSTNDLCWFGPRSFQPAAPQIPGATYSWDFGADAAPSTASGYGPHVVEFSTTGSKSIQLTVSANYPNVSCPATSFLNFEVTQCFGNISGGVFSDTHGGPPISNVLIALFQDFDEDGVPDSGTPQQVTFTTGAGLYAFTVLMPASYVVFEVQPSGFSSLFDEDISEDFDSVANGTPFDNLIPVTVEPLITDAGNNFIETLQLANVSGTVYEDLNNDGEIDPGEGIEGVLIRLYQDLNNDGLPDLGIAVDSAYTLVDGSYGMTALDTGQYVLVEEQPVGYISVQDIDESNDADATPNSDPTDDIIPVSLFPGEEDMDNNFKEADPCTRIVVNTNDDGIGSLRFTIDCAVNGDTIWFDSELAGDTIVLTSTELNIFKDLVIYSPHSPSITVLSDVSRVITVESGQTVEIRGLDFVGGIAGDPQCIDNAGMLTLHDVNISRNVDAVNSNKLLFNDGGLVIRGACEINE